MRLIGHLANEAGARTFSDYLYVQGIENQIEFEKDDGWAVWISQEDQLEQAGALLAAFRLQPDDPRYQGPARNAAALRAEEEKSRAAFEQRVRNRRHLFRPLTPYSFGVLTYVLIVLSVVVFLYSKMGRDMQPVMALFISPYRDELGLHLVRGLTEIRRGELWRLVTPIFIHFDVMHILFNMLWLKDLGSMIEARQNTLVLGLLVLVLAVSSNLGQYYMSGPNFGGMSGVVYGLLGYIWIRGKFDPASGLYLHRSTVVMMMAWFVLCLSGVLGHIANTAHAVGLGVGVAWGFVSSRRLFRS